ncbi:MAG: hypothetical protein K2Q22_08400 [Cytophagales bacterium]|nr:hypothetical protein [Cytophagales bacterium]
MRVYFVCEKYPEDDFALELDVNQFDEGEALDLFREKLKQLPKLRLKLKDFLDYHYSRYSGEKMDFIDYLDLNISNESGSDKVKEWIGITRSALTELNSSLDFAKKVAFEEIPVKWADTNKDLSTWIAKMIKEGYFSVKDAKSAELFFEKIFK